MAKNWRTRSSDPSFSSTFTSATITTLTSTSATITTATITNLNLAAASVVTWSGRTKLSAPSDGELKISNNAATAGVLFGTLTTTSGFWAAHISGGNVFFRTPATLGTFNFQDNSGNITGAANCDWLVPKSKPTAGTLTDSTTFGQPHGRTAWCKFSWTNAMITALGAVTSGDITVCTLPAKTLVKRCFIVISTAGATVAALTGSVGFTGDDDAYVADCDLKGAANTVYGDAIAEIGASLQSGGGAFDHLPSYTGTTAVLFHVDAGAENLNTVTTSTGIILLQVEVLP